LIWLIDAPLAPEGSGTSLLFENGT
jgi:hypothetical protein